jgi:hypothetical protein
MKNIIVKITLTLSLIVLFVVLTGFITALSLLPAEISYPSVNTAALPFGYPLQ